MDVNSRRVAVTGVGMVTPLGRSLRSIWKKLVNGESGAALLPEGPLRQAGARYFCPVADADFSADGCRHLAFAERAARAALDDAGMSVAGRRGKTGVCLASSKGSFGTIEQLCRALHEVGPAAVDAAGFWRIYAETPAAVLARRLEIGGPLSAPVAACATGAHAIVVGRLMIMAGAADVVIAGATESCISPLLLAGYRNMGVLAADADSPAEACRPYDAGRDGFVLGEGSGIVILESVEHAAARGARVRAELKGGAIGEDIFHPTAPDPSGTAMSETISAALRGAHLRAEEIDYINTHGTATRLNDPSETRAVRTAFGEAARRISLSSTKPMTGHLLGAAGSVEFIIALMALEHGSVPPTINLRRPDPECDLDYTPRAARRRAVRNVMSISCGFGGQIAVLIAGRTGK